MSRLSEQLQRHFGIELTDLRGAHVTVALPFTASLVNRLIAQRLSTLDGRIAAVSVGVHEEQRLTVTLVLRGPRLIPALKIAARIEQQPEFPGRPVLGLRWSMPGLGPLARLASPVLAFLQALPTGLHVVGDRVTVDIGELLREQELEDLLETLTRLDIETREGVFVVHLAARI